ncbi:MAG: hydroxyacid dehydrogenase, partial [Pseudomonadota bacterium]
MTTAKPRVLVSDALSETAVQIFRDNGIDVTFEPQLGKDKDKLAAMIGEFDGLAVRSATKVTEKLIEKATNLKAVGRAGIGVDNVDIKAATARGIVVMNTPFGNSVTTAEHAISLLLALTREIPAADRSTQAGEWAKSRFMGTEITGKTLGIIGYGRIGQEMARRAHHGFGMNIVVQNRSRVAPEVLAQCNATQVDTVEDLLPQCDFVSLHCPGGAENRHLINARRLDLMKEDAFLINTARGEVIDEWALTQALTFDTIGGAALDVFDGEPRIAPDLMQCDNLVML